MTPDVVPCGYPTVEAHEFDLMAEVQRLRHELATAHVRWSNCHADSMATQERLNEANAELASYKAQPFVPATEHQRVLEQRNDALKLADALTRQLADASDRRVQRLADERLILLRNVSAILGKTAHGMDERAAVNAVHAHVVVHGGPSPEIQAMRDAWDKRGEP